MWKKLLYVALIAWMAESIQSAVLDCDPFMHYCSTISITPVTQPNEVITFNGQPANYVNPNITFIALSNQVVNYIPTGLFAIFPNLNTLSLENCETILTTDSIPNCDSMIAFAISGGSFSNIPSGFLQSCRNMSYLSMSGSNILTVDEGAFRGLNNLSTLFLTNTNISSFPAGTFQNTPSMKSMFLSYNMLTSIDSNLFANLKNLTMLMLDNNLLTIIPMLKLDVKGLYLSIDQNLVYAVSPDFCSYFVTNETVSMSVHYFNITCVPDSRYSRVQSVNDCYNNLPVFSTCFSNWYIMFPTTIPPTTIPLTTIQPPTTVPLTTVPLTTVPPTTAVITTPSPVDSVLTSISGNHLITFADANVRRVIFTNSFLSRIPPILFFKKFTGLEYLTVSNCSMSAINTNTFTACGTLKYFDASNNFITTVDGASFKSCAALEVIDLTGNKFDMIDGQLFVNNPALKAVYINRPPAMVLV